MAERDSTPEETISQTQRRTLVGYRPKGGDRSTPQVSLSGQQLAEASLEVGTGVSLKVMDGCLLIPDGPEERRPKALEKQLLAQQAAMEQICQQIKAVLA